MTWWQTTLLSINALGLLAAGATPTYWKLLQPNPEIRNCEPETLPYMNAGVDERGVRPQIVRKGLMIPPSGWRPVRKDTFRVGDTAWVLRNDMFLNKVSGPVQRSFISDDGLSIVPLPTIYPPKTTPSGECSLANFAIDWPPKERLTPGGWTYKAEVMMFKNMLFPIVPTPFAPAKIIIVE